MLTPTMGLTSGDVTLAARNILHPLIIMLYKGRNPWNQEDAAEDIVCEKLLGFRPGSVDPQLQLHTLAVSLVDSLRPMPPRQATTLLWTVADNALIDRRRRKDNRLGWRDEATGKPYRLSKNDIPPSYPSLTDDNSPLDLADSPTQHPSATWHFSEDGTLSESILEATS